MNSRQRVETALNHEQPDYVPLDLGASPVTGMQVSSVYKLRQALGLDRPGMPVKVVEPYQMLGEIAPICKRSSAWTSCAWAGGGTCSALTNAGWKPWTTFDGTPVLVPERFNTVPDANGDILLYPEGDASVPPSGRMPKGGFYFDSITRQEPIDDDTLRVEDNLEEFGPVSDADLQYFAREAQRLRSESDRAILANFGGTAFGDIAPVPAPWLKQPKGIRDVAEWYMSTAAAGRFRLPASSSGSARSAWRTWPRSTRRWAIGSRWCSSPAPISARRPDRSSTPRAIAVSTSRSTRRINDWVHEHTTWKTFIHSCGSVVALVNDFIDAGFDILNPVQCSAVGIDPQTLKDKFGSQDHVLGRRGRHAEDAPLRHAGRRPPRGPRADRDLQPRRRFRLQHGAQRAGRHAHGEPAGGVRDGEGVATVGKGVRLA